MEKLEQFNFKTTKEDRLNIDHITTKEKVNKTEAIRIALKQYKETNDLVKTLKKIVSQQEKSIELLEEMVKRNEK
ncbi:MAG: hypothetical protein PHW29_04375 [Flavobacterium sp.]|nr:hypothetical protein [Flavobacterium sp.]